MKRKTYDQWQHEINENNKRTPVYVQCDCSHLALKVYRENYFQCTSCQKKYDASLKEISN